jgi:hypothetical protein
MVVKKRQISYLIEDQLPSFISTDYPQFARFLEKYYEQIESQGQPLDVINNIDRYRDIDYYEENLLKQSSTLDGIISNSDTTITVIDGSSFPEKNGYIRIGDEICFYKNRNENVFSEVTRGVSGNTKLGDLYETTEFITTQSSSHESGSIVYNISNLFLYAFLKSFESENLSSFPEAYLKKEIDKRTLIKNITDFYKVKGTESSIKFIFNSIIARDVDNVPTTYNPKNYTLKASTSDWVTTYSLKVKVISGDVFDIIGNQIIQTDGVNYASAIVDNVRVSGGIQNEQIYEIILNPDTVNGDFKISSRTKLEKSISASDTEGDRIVVESTVGWNKIGTFYVGNEKFTFEDKNVKQFYIKSRSSSSTHSTGDLVYDYIPLKFGNVELMVFGVLYNLNKDVNLPYSFKGDDVQISDAGFNTRDRVIFNSEDETIRWFINELNTSPTALTNANLQSQLQEYIADVSAIYEDDQNYYICSSGYPSYDILTASVSGTLIDPKNLKIIRKNPIETTEVYGTTSRDVGVFVDGTLAFGYKDEEFVKYGNIVKTTVTSRGSGYINPPYVLINDQPGKAISILSGETVESISITQNEIYTQDPEITITSGRNAQVQAIVTNGEITGLVIVNPGEYYSSPPEILISDRSGRGRFASYESIVSQDGKLVDFVQVNKGKLYNKDTVEVFVIPSGKDAKASAEIRKWVKDRYKKLQSSLDTGNGYIFDDVFTNDGKQYGIVANPLKLRAKVGDNLNNLLQEPANKIHSKILGYAYDGNPVYGPFGYSDPGDNESAIIRLESGYLLNQSRSNGPAINQYPIGTFVDDYTWTQNQNTGRSRLDKNNGRYCVTPEYPEGTYAYFVSTDASNLPVFPYIIGENYYSLPISSNYDSTLSQDELPRNSRRLNTGNLSANGYNSFATVQSTTKGSINSAIVDDSADIFSVGSQLNLTSQVLVDNFQTGGEGASASVSEIYGREIEAIEGIQNKVVLMSTRQQIYFFNGGTVTQDNTGATGEIYGDSFNTDQFILRSVSGEFNTTDKISSDTVVLNLILDKESNFTQGSTVSLFDGINSIIATGEVLNSTSNQNAVRIKVLTGSFVVDDNYSLSSSNLSDTPGSKILTIVSLSNNIDVFSINDKVILGRTVDSHNLGINDVIDLTIDPDDNTTETLYYIRKKKYQAVRLRTPQYASTINDTGIGRIDTLIGGADYAATTYGGGTFTDIEVLFSNPAQSRNAIGQTVGQSTSSTIGLEGGENNAKATVVVGYTKTVTDFNSAINTITVDDTSRIFVGMNVRGQNISAGTVVQSVDTSTKVVTLFNSQIAFPITGSVTSAVFNPGVISSVTITEKGKDYRRGDTVTFKDTDLDKGTIPNSRDYLAIVDHVGFSTSDTELFLNDIRGVSEQDLIQVGSEIVKVTAVDVQNAKLTVTRGQNNTSITDHFNGSKVILSDPQYRFNTGSQIGSGSAGDPYVVSYDKSTQVLVVSYGYGVTNINQISLSSLFEDESTPAKKISVNNLININNRFEYSKDNVNFEILENLQIQKNYSYKFDTSHISMTNTYLEFSPSINKNILALDTYRSPIAPGLSGSHIKIKPGKNFLYFYGSTVGDNNIVSGNSLVSDSSQNVEYTRYYFFDKNEDVETNGGYFDIVDDPLQGKKKLIFTTNTGFVYEYNNTPQYDGSGDIEYSTTNKSAVGRIKSVKIDNVGKNYEVIPSVLGVVPSKSLASVIDVVYDSVNNKIASIKLTETGSNYTKPKAVVLGNGSGAEIELVERDGKIVSAIVKNGGFNYSEPPVVKVVETSVKIYLGSDNIGVPESIKVENSGFLYNTDETLSRQFFSNTALILTDFPENAFAYGEEVVLENDGVTFATAVVSKNGWKTGSNILKVRNVSGKFIKGLTIKGKARGNTAKVVDVITSKFKPVIRSYFDNIGYYSSDRGKISTNSQKLTDSYFYQDYSYVIKSRTPISVWRDLIKQTTHPAGFKLFGEVIIESSGKNEMQNINTRNYTIVNLAPKSVSNLSTKRTIKESFVNFNNLSEERGIGSVSVDSQSNTETYATEIILSAPFDGQYDENTGKVVGTKTFTIKDKITNAAIVPYNEEQLLITLDGVVQEPGVAYTVSGSTITFATAPLGTRIAEDQTVPAQTFYGKSFRFKSDTLNEEYLKKVRNFFQRSGRWLDAANQVRFNKDFIVEESLGYVVNEYPNVPWNLYRSEFSSNIRNIVNAYEHDLRFGGNFKTITAAQEYEDTNLSVESLDAFKYVAKLCTAASKNWDYTVLTAVITELSDIVTVPSTFGIVVGMNVSSGNQFPENTKVTEIVNNTQIRVSQPARSGAGVPSLIVNAGETVVIEQDSVYAGVFNAGDLDVGTVSVANGGTVSLTSVYSVGGIPQITFSLSKINNGTFYDASNLIAANKLYIQEETLGWIKAQYPLLVIPNESKCKRDTGYLVDAVVYSLKYGGTQKIIDFAKAYYDGNSIILIDGELTESVEAFQYAIGLMILAMRNTLPSGTYTSETPFSDPNILVDPNEYFPACAEVESALTSYSGIIGRLLLEGINLVQAEPENNQRVGNWTTIRTYSNFNIIKDPLLLDSECADVELSLETLYSGIESVITNGIDSVTKTNPDYIDGENTDFELFYEDGSDVRTNSTEDLLVFINGVIQLPGTYEIVRSGTTDVVSFSSPPKWEQESNIITVQEPLALDKTFVVRVGSYETLTINADRISIKKTGPFVLFDRENGNIRAVDDSNYAYVFIDGVLQKKDTSYTLNGSTITFKEPLESYTLSDGSEVLPRVDVLVLYGRDLDKKLTFYDFEPNTYLNKIALTINDTTPDNIVISSIINYWYNNWDYSQFGISPVTRSEYGVFLLETNSITGKISNIGEIKKINRLNSENLNMTISGNNVVDLDPNGDYTICIGAYLTDSNKLTFTASPDVTLSFSYFEDAEGNRNLIRNVKPRLYDTPEADEVWKTRNLLLANLYVGDKIKIDGESSFRNIVSLPEIVNLKDFRKGKEVSNEIYGSVGATNYNGLTRGLGLGIIAEIENGSITDLIWNKRDLQLFVDYQIKDKETAIGYYTPPIIQFIPVDENGGGASAEVLVVNKSIVDIIITNPGSGYTQAPKVIISRGYTRIKNNRQINYTISFDYEPKIKLNTILSITSEITILQGGIQPKVYASFEVLQSPVSVERKITEIITPDEESVTISSQREIAVHSTLNLAAEAFTLSKVETLSTTIVESEVKEIKVQHSKTLNVQGTFLGVVDKAYAEDYTEGLYSQGILGNRLVCMESSKFIDTGYSDVSKLTIEEFSLAYPECLISDFDEPDTVKVTTTIDNKFNLGYPSIQNFGALLDISLNETDNIVYISDTSSFANEGFLLIGDEIVSYTSKLSDRFLNVSRGVSGTVAQSHTAGDYLRTF